MTGTPSVHPGMQRWTTVLDGGRLQELRRQRELSQEQLATVAGISLTTIRRLDLLTEQDREFPQFIGWVAGSGGTFCGHDRRW
jgi:DNA-binding XRE family transcriptional regulator